VPWHAPAQVILDDPVADDYVAEDDLNAPWSKGNYSSYAHYQGKFDIWKTKAAVIRDHGGICLADAWHVCEDDIVSANGTRGVCVGISRGLVERRTLIIPIDIKESFDGIGF
jgi:hypothetical protein